jgi:EAL domain-containing protein (putative c-di-GMP-specific phosphodiesterase class I)
MESLGFINEIDKFVLEASCRQLKVLESLYADVSIAVNISSTHFTEGSFLLLLKSCLGRYPINPQRLELEITETLLMENMGAGLEVINEIKSLGVSIAIDDFGTGYSSLSYLKNLPVDTLKIDREFIKDIPDSESDMQISSVIIFLAKQLNFKVVAEGVETSEQLVFLKANQCDLAQGFYFSQPVPAHQALLLLETERLSQ